jgi:hypothetical protein
MASRQPVPTAHATARRDPHTHPLRVATCRTLVPEAGLEPALPCGKGLLRPPRLPVSPSGPPKTRKERHLPAPPSYSYRYLLRRPHGRSANKSGKRDSNPRPQPWQGCALPTELFPRAPNITPRTYGRQAGRRQSRHARRTHPRKPSACIAYHTVDASSPANAASPPSPVARPSASTSDAAIP